MGETSEEEQLVGGVRPDLRHRAQLAFPFDLQLTQRHPATRQSRSGAARASPIFNRLSHPRPQSPRGPLGSGRTPSHSASYESRQSLILDCLQ